MTRAVSRFSLWGLCALLAATPTLPAQPDDTEACDKLPRYEGPGYRSGQRGGPPPEFLSQSAELLAWITLPEFGDGSIRANDCWGYVSPSGREYAIIGLQLGTGFVEITNPANPSIVAVMSGPGSLWRDIKTYQHYAYAVSEGGQGIQIFDLGDIDNGVVDHLGNAATFNTHNVAINTDSGFLYRCGGGSSNGLRIYSLTDPEAPTFVASWSDRYVHDAQIVSYTTGPYAGREIAFCCSGFNGGSGQTGVDILDVTDKQNIINLTRLVYADGEYSHQAWLSPDRRYLYLNDELDEGVQNGVITYTKTFVIDVSDLEDPFVANTFNNGNLAIGHNLYTRDNLLFEANYNSGVRLFDVTDPLNGVEVAYFDTRPENNNPNFNGAWSVYPYFSDNVVIVSDMVRGLFIVRMNTFTPEFSFPIGLTEQTLENQPTPVTVQIDAPELPTAVNLFARVGGGSFTSIPMTDVGGSRWQADLPPANCPDRIQYYFSADFADPDFTYLNPKDAPAYLYSAVPLARAQLTTLLDDDFETDQGWTIINSPELTQGNWERTVPVSNAGYGNPPGDFDGSGRCYVTLTGTGKTDVDDGTTTLVSPAFDLSGTDGLVRYAQWYTNDFNGHPGTDDWVVEITNNGTDWVEVERCALSPGWIVQSFVVSEYVTPTDQVRLRFSASDFDLLSVVEAAIDMFSMTAFECFACSNLLGDINQDCVVNLADFAIFSNCFGLTSPNENCSATEFALSDLNSDGGITLVDFAILAVNFGT